MNGVLELTMHEERHYIVAAGLQHVIGLPDTPKVRRLLEGRHFDEVVCVCGDRQARLRCVRVYFDPHTRILKWRVELGEVLR